MPVDYMLPAAVGLLVIHISDFAAIKKVPLVKPLVWVAGGGLLIYSIVQIWLSPDRLSLPAWSAWLGWALLAVSSIMLVYSLFVNLPFFKTYVATGVGDKLVTTGFYALARHPGVLWTALLAVSIVLVSKSRPALVAAPLFILLDVLVVVIQDRIFFPRMFPGYDAYRRQTPMLLPNRNSLRAFADSLKAAKPPKGDGRHVWRRNGGAG
jgi:protein-S-isoprenylcysteine O-methyltransferase Ste14